MPGDRTEQATPHRRERARQDGDLLHSRELSAAAGTLAGVLVLGGIGARIVRAWRDEFISYLDLSDPVRWEPERIADAIDVMRRDSLMVLTPVALLMATIAASDFCVGIAQTGGLTFSFDTLRFRLDRVNPVANLKNLFSLRAA